MQPNTIQKPTRTSKKRFKILQRSLSQKNLMALTGLFLCVFLVIHLAGNLQLLLPEAQARLQFNWYAKFLSGLLPIKVISYLLFLSIVAHTIYALFITLHNRKAQGVQKYVYDRRHKASPWASRNMGFLGTVLLLFIVIHMKDFWYVYQFGALPKDEAGNKDLYEVVAQSFQQLWYVAIYEVAMLALGFHLWHGFQSAFKTIGLYHPKFARWVYYVGILYTTVITLGFLTIPIYIYLML